MANHIAGVAKLLGVEVGEVFQIDKDPTLNGCVFRFSNNDLQLSGANVDNDTWVVANDNRLLGLLYGSLSIRKLPWKPKMNEEFYVPCIHYTDSSMATKLRWRDDNADNKFYQFGIVCMTRGGGHCSDKEDAEISRENNDTGGEREWIIKWQRFSM